MKKNTHIILKKIAHLNEEYYTNESANKQEQGEMWKGIPEGHVVEGVLTSDIKIEEPLFMLRTKRNGVSSFGATFTSNVMKISGDIIETTNSKYQVTIVDDK